MTTTFIKYLENRLKQKLPGSISQNRMAALRTTELKPTPVADKAGVLILIFPRKGDLSTTLIKRTEYPGPHSGQISFPGGKTEKTDSSQIGTALREAAEETGIDSSQISVLGTLTPLYIAASNIEVLPVVGYADRQPDFIIHPIEVEYLIHISLKGLTGNSLKTEKKLSINGITINAPGFKIQNEFIWGATAMILSEFTEIVSDAYRTIQ
jgi:8-oxo-dGTP pyrophosphatase MutT (NUDIX family)